MSAINFMDRKIEMRKISFVLWVTSLVLLMQAQPLCAMEKKEESRNQKLEKARIIKQEMLRKIELVSQQQLERNPQKEAERILELQKAVIALIKVPSQECNHIDKLKILLKSEKFTDEMGRNEYGDILKSVIFAKVSTKVQQALAKKLLQKTSAILANVISHKNEIHFTKLLREKMNTLILREENVYREKMMQMFNETKHQENDKKQITPNGNIFQKLEYSEIGKLTHFFPFFTIDDGNSFFHAAFTKVGETAEDVGQKVAKDVRGVYFALK